ncbi:B12-binding domain-containing radical SAM protein [Kordiimonas aestuarii]|uniref:B12-binding domain-containing radical SAM protein n=1 Tax=Kordiimonas aestuarii TaxID=1005925 RepID=UPI0021CE5312|nr:radical SAM protein [Kordiimonas aestuarii]
MAVNFEVYLIKPTRYCDDGYPLQWWRSLIPSNSLASVNGIAVEAVTRNPLGNDVAINIHVIDEINTDVRPDRIITSLKTSGRKALICLVGAQTNQFPRSVDLARQFVGAGIPVCIGGFHVSGCLSMLKDLPPDLQEAQALGISFFAGEAEEHRFDEILVDAYRGDLKPIYNHVRNTPDMANAPIPILPDEPIKRTVNAYTSFDLGRGCPFECSFCTIINVQGRKSRFRTADDLETIVRENAKIGINRFFLTDDNFARNKNWREFTNRLIKLKAEGFPIAMIIQVDTLAHRIEGFIDACAEAGANQIFIGLESINADSLEAVKKRQNRIEEYREMFLAWKRHPVFITCGYIIGFPTDTPASIVADIETIKKNLPVDGLYLNYLTPLPGSADHKALYEAGVWMDPDMNKYDLNHRVSHHAHMSDEEWEATYQAAHATFYTWEHMETIIRRMVALRSNKKKLTVKNLFAYREAPRLEGISAFEAGILRVRRRTQRRSGMPIESPFVFYPKYTAITAIRLLTGLVTFLRLRRILKRTLKDPARFDYRDEAITGENPGGEDTLLRDTRMTETALKRMNRRSDTKVA